MFSLEVVWPWQPQANPFWRDVLAGAVVFVPTVAFAVFLERSDRRYQRRLREEADARLREVLMGNLYLELLFMGAFANAFLKFAKEAKKTRNMQSQISHRPSTITWESSQADLMRLGMPGRTGVALAFAYHAWSSLIEWTDHIRNMANQKDFDAAAISQALGEDVGQSTDDKIQKALVELQAWAMMLNINIAEMLGIKEYLAAQNAKGSQPG